MKSEERDEAYDAGFAEGHDCGYDEGFEAGFEEGRLSGYADGSSAAHDDYSSCINKLGAELLTLNARIDHVQTKLDREASNGD